jgi:hypothetical protein
MLVHDESVSVLVLVSLLAAGAQPIEDPASIDLCQLIPGADVAKLFGKTLKETRPFSSKNAVSRCIYAITDPGSPETAAGYSLWLYPPGKYDDFLPTTEGIVEMPSDLGDRAVLYRERDLLKLRLVVRPRFTLEAVASDGESAKKLARLALAKLSP